MITRLAQMQVRRGTAAAWTSANPTLLAGEWGLETDTGIVKIGDGSTAWSALAKRYATNGYKTLFIGAADMVPRTTDGPAVLTEESSTYKQMSSMLLFDPATPEYAQFKLVMPDNWDLGTVKAKFYWRRGSTTGGSGDVLWALGAKAIGNDDTFDTNFGSAQFVTDTFINDTDIHITDPSAAITIAGQPALGDLISFQIYRFASSVIDTYGEDAGLLGVSIQYKESPTPATEW